MTHNRKLLIAIYYLYSLPFRDNTLHVMTLYMKLKFNVNRNMKTLHKSCKNDSKNIPSARIEKFMRRLE